MSLFFERFIDQLFKSPLVFFVIAAVILIALAIIGKIPWPKIIDLSTGQRVGLALFGTILVVISVSAPSIQTTGSIPPSPTVTLSPTPTPTPAYPSNRAFSCQKCQISPLILPTLVNITVNKPSGTIQVKLKLQDSSSQNPYISIGDINTEKTSFMSLTTPDKQPHKLANTASPPSDTTLNGNINNGKELAFIFALPVNPGQYEIGLQLLIGRDIVIVYDPIPFVFSDSVLQVLYSSLQRGYTGRRKG